MREKLLEFLAITGAATVEQIAKYCHISDQHARTLVNRSTEQEFLEVIAFLAKNKGRHSNIYSLTKSGALEVGINRIPRITKEFVIKSILKSNYTIENLECEYEIVLDEKIEIYHDLTGMDWPFKMQGAVTGGYDSLFCQSNDLIKFAVPVIGNKLAEIKKLSDTSEVIYLCRDIDERRIKRNVKPAEDNINDEYNIFGIERDFNDWKSLYNILPKEHKEHDNVKKIMISLQKNKDTLKELQEEGEREKSNKKGNVGYKSYKNFQVIMNNSW